MPEDNAIAIHYGEINNVLEQLYKKLYRKLRANEVALSSNYQTDFTRLIDHMNDIPAIERYYDTNIKPEDEIILSNDFSGMSLREYNLLLAQKVNFYMRLMGYYLALKGVPIEHINNALTLNERIDLIDEIDRLYLVVFLVNVPEKNYYGEYINVNYEIVDLQNEKVEDGIIEVYYGEDLVKRINIGEPLKFKPIDIGRDIYKFVFSKSSRYKATRVTKSILVKDRNAIEQIFLFTNTSNSIDMTNGNLNIDYTTANMNTPQNVLIDINIDNEDELCLTYEEYDKIDFTSIDKGITSISIGRDEEWNPCLEYVTVQTDNVEEPSP